MANTIYKAVCFGEVLWDMLPSGAQPGGAPMNVAYHLQKLGIETALISRTGKDRLGDDLKQVLQNNRLSTRFVQTDEQHPTGIVNATILANNEASYEIVYPSAWDFIAYEPELSALVASAAFFICGSLAARSPVSGKTLMQLKTAAATRVVDINLRPPHYSQSLVEELLSGAEIVKLNEHEADLISGWFSGTGSLEEKVKLIQERFDVSMIIVTRGEKGALVRSRQDWAAHPGYRVVLADTVGSGDAFLAAFLHRWSKGAALEECLKFANALGALIASKQGACPAYDIKEAELLMTGS